MNTKSINLFFLLILCFYTQIRSEAIIKPFQEDQDMLAVEKILNDYFTVLTYESKGYKEGTTKKYLVSSKYTTKVLHIDGKVVGFINYAVIEPPFLLKWLFGKQGFIHLMGVDSAHQSQGYGRMLSRHVLQELKNKQLPKAAISVKRENMRARSFYEKEGFVCAIPEESQPYFADLIYEKNL